jgi:dihydroneopterin aldolase
MDKIRINNIQLFAYHGVADEEQLLGQKFEIDVELNVDLSIAGKSDDLSKTVDYSYIYEIIKNEFCNSKFRLLETVAEKISEKLLNIELIQLVIIKIRKPNAPINGNFDSVEIEIERK